MKISDIRLAYASQPFRAFSIRVADGREYRVKHPEFLAFSVGGRSIVVSTADGFYEIIDTAMVTSIHFGNGNRRKPRPKGS